MQRDFQGLLMDFSWKQKDVCQMCMRFRYSDMTLILPHSKNLTKQLFVFLGNVALYLLLLVILTDFNSDLYLLSVMK